MNLWSKKTLSLTVLIIALMLVVMGCQSNNKEVALEKTPTDQSLVLGLMPDEASVPFIIAQEQGYFEEEGIDVSTQVFFSAIQRDTALQAGELQGISTDIISAGLFKNKTNDYVVTSQTQGTFALVGHDLASIEALKKAAQAQETIKVGLSTNTLMEFVFDEMMAQEGISQASIEKVNIAAIPNRLEMLNQGQIDLATLPQPFYSAALAKDNYDLGTISDYNVNPGVVLLSQEVAANAAFMDHFNAAYNKAVDYINETPVETYYPVLVEHLSFPEQMITLPEYTPIQLPAKSDIQAGLTWLKNKAFITQTWSYENMVLDTINK